MNQPESRYCARCGTRLAAPVAAPGPPPPLTTIELRRLGLGDLVALAGTVVAFVSLYLPWYSVSLGGFAPLYSGAIGSISALGDGAGGWRFLILVLCLIITGYMFLRTMSPRGLRLPLPHWQLMTVLTGSNLLLLLISFLVKPGGGTTVPGLTISWDYGAYLGLGAGALAVVGAVVRRNDPELPDSRAPRAAAATPSGAPPAAQPPAPGTHTPDRTPDQL